MFEKEMMKQKNKWIKLNAVLLSVAMLLSLIMIPRKDVCAYEAAGRAISLNNPRITTDSSLGRIVTYDAVWFGYYPQAEVVASSYKYDNVEDRCLNNGDVIYDSELYTKLCESDEWNEYNDLFIGPIQYHRMKASDATFYDTYDTRGYYCWHKDYSTYRYFRYEPIKWRVLSVENGKALLLADKVIDNQVFDLYYKSMTFHYYTWDTSTIRSFLNSYSASNNTYGKSYSGENGFRGRAFTALEQKYIINTSVTTREKVSAGKYTDVTVNDSIFLLDESDINATDNAVKYGLSDDIAYSRIALSSTYAKAMGTWFNVIDKDDPQCGSASWLLRSIYDTYDSRADYVDGWGKIKDISKTGHDGVRPALYADISQCSLEPSDIIAYAGTVSSDGTKDETSRVIPDRIEKLCGENLTWSLVDDPDYENGKKLIIKGKGDMYDYSEVKPSPWVQEMKALYDKLSEIDKKNYPAAITNVDIAEGVTRIGDNAFNDFDDTYSVAEGFYTMPSSIKKIGKAAFKGNSKLKRVIFSRDFPEVHGCTSDEDNSSFDSDIILFREDDDPEISDIEYEGYSVVPYNYKNGFSLIRDGFPVINSLGGMGTDGVETEFFKNFWNKGPGGWCRGVLNGVEEFINLNTFGGYCFGFSILAAAEYEKKIDMKSKYFSNMQGERLNEYGCYGTYNSSYGYSVFSYNNDQKFISTLQSAWVSQFAHEFRAARVFKDSEKNSIDNLYNYLIQDNANPILITYENTNGGYHTITIDTSVKPIENGSKFTVFCYDCNHPVSYKYLRNAMSNYYVYPTYVEFDRKDNSFTVYAQRHDIDGKGDNNLDLAFLDTDIKFYDISELKKSFYEKIDKAFFELDEGGDTNALMNTKKVSIYAEESGDGRGQLVYSYSNEKGLIDHIETSEGASSENCCVYFKDGDVASISCMFDPEKVYTIKSEGNSEVFIPFNKNIYYIKVSGNADTKLSIVDGFLHIDNKENDEITFEAGIVTDDGKRYIAADGTIDPACYVEFEIGEESSEEKFTTDSNEDNIEVRSDYTEPNKVTGVKLNRTSAELYVGSTLQLKASIYPGNATDKSLIWRSNDTDVATVDSKGKVTAKKVGVAYITVLTNDGDYWARCKVTVKNKTSGDDNPTDKVKSVNMIRMYNKNSGEHFYTSSQAEVRSLTNAGWINEGIAWKAPVKSKTPVYRLYNANAGDHHYTISSSEKNNLVNAGWKYEGIGWYSDDAKGVPLYRLYNPNAKAGSHHYTISKSERNNLVSCGWKDEGISWYGVK